MNFIAAIFRGIHRNYLALFSFLRVLKLKLLYPGISINFGTTIESGCLIKCIKGGKLLMTDCAVSAGTQILVDAGGIASLENVFIGRNCVITCKQSITIRKGCLIAEMVVIRDQDHIVAAQDGSFSRDRFDTAPVLISENVWIAAKATILKGVTIGRNAVVAASAVVTKPIPGNEVWGGIPAKFLKNADAGPAAK